MTTLLMIMLGITVLAILESMMQVVAMLRWSSITTLDALMGDE
jgi:hypothetical protein